MRINLGAKVITKDGQEVGKIDRFIVDPKSDRVREFVVRKGFFVEHDILVPMDWGDASFGDHDDSVVHLTQTAYAVKQLPEFVEANYAAAPDGLYPGLLGDPYYAYEGGGWLWPASHYEPAAQSGAVQPTDATAADGDSSNIVLPGMLDDALAETRPVDVIISPGTDVKTRAGDKIGTVDDLVIDPKRGKVTEIIIKKGIINHKEIRIPTQFIEKIADDGVHVVLDKERLERFTVDV
jgi:uncharacterized protein YrrD